MPRGEWTYKIAREAAVKTGDASMRQSGRNRWGRADYKAAVNALVRLTAVIEAEEKAAAELKRRETGNAKRTDGS